MPRLLITQKQWCCSPYSLPLLAKKRAKTPSSLSILQLSPIQSRSCLDLTSIFAEGIDVDQYGRELLWPLQIVPSPKLMIQHSHVAVTATKLSPERFSTLSRQCSPLIIVSLNDPASFRVDDEGEKRQPPLTFSISHCITRQGPELTEVNLEKTNEEVRGLHLATNRD